jgi:hypothetical protein
MPVKQPVRTSGAVLVPVVIVLWESVGPGLDTEVAHVATWLGAPVAIHVAVAAAAVGLIVVDVAAVVAETVEDAHMPALVVAAVVVLAVAVQLGTSVE